MKKLIIVWRNPDSARHPQRLQRLQREVGRSLYIVQHLVSQGDRGYWATTSSLELLRGGRAIA